MTKRNPLQWYDATVEGVGVDGKIPECVQCVDLLFSPGFLEAVHSVAIERPGSPADMARWTIDQYHANRHQA